MPTKSDLKAELRARKYEKTQFTKLGRILANNYAYTDIAFLLLQKTRESLEFKDFLTQFDQDTVFDEPTDLLTFIEIKNLLTRLGLNNLLEKNTYFITSDPSNISHSVRSQESLSEEKQSMPVYQLRPITSVSYQKDNLLERKPITVKRVTEECLHACKIIEDKIQRLEDKILQLEKRLLTREDPKITIPAKKLNDHNNLSPISSPETASPSPVLIHTPVNLKKPQKSIFIKLDENNFNLSSGFNVPVNHLSMNSSEINGLNQNHSNPHNRLFRNKEDQGKDRAYTENTLPSCLKKNKSNAKSKQVRFTDWNQARYDLPLTDSSYYLFAKGSKQELKEMLANYVNPDHIKALMKLNQPG